MLHFHLVVTIFLLLAFAGCESDHAQPGHGVEIFPPGNVNHAALSRVDALPVTVVFFRDNWTWVGFGDAECGEDCHKRLALIDGQSGGRGLFTMLGIAGHQLLRDLGRKYANTAVTMGTTAASVDGFYAQFDAAGPAAQPSLNMLYLVNPQAEVVYRVDTSLAGDLNLDHELQAAMALGKE